MERPGLRMNPPAERGRAGSVRMAVRRDSSVCDVVARLWASRLGCLFLLARLQQNFSNRSV